MKYQRNNFIYLLFCFLVQCLTSCFSPLEDALTKAGDNRSEIEKVLSHYKKNESDSLKLKAAMFLIENMPGHKSIVSPDMDKYYKEVDSILSNRSNSNRLKDILNIYSKYESSFIIVEDINIIKADYLINNIDSAFSVWQEKPWAKHVGFSDFCEYILPYKSAERQPMEDWRKVFYGKYENSMRVIKYCDRFQHSAYWACTYVNQELRRLNIKLGKSATSIPLFPSLLVKLPSGTCTEYGWIGANVMRSKGIPVAIDFTPQWPFRSQSHSWNVLLANSGKNVIFTGADSDPGKPHKEDDKMGKVFRQTYAINHELLDLIDKEKYVPNNFQDCFIKDVTSEYMVTQDVEIEELAKLKCKAQYAYLAVFDNKEWIPIHWAKIKKGKALFKNMGRDIVYLPVYYTQKGIRPMAHPFLLDQKGKVHILNADVINTRTIYLNRKYPVYKKTFEAAERMVGGKIQVSNYEDFRDSLTLYQITDWCNSGKFTNIPDSAWRYWRYLSPKNGLCNISELMFYEKSSKQPIKGKIIGTNGSCFNNPKCLKETVFDGDPFTFFDAPISDIAPWVGMDFEKKVKLSQIIYIPRTDGNMIQLGDSYQLYWWSINGWSKLDSTFVAKDIILKYTKAPQNALFWLRNISRGKEERPFTYEKNKQIWW